MPGPGRIQGIPLYRDERGFTLPELLVVIAILGILLVIAIIIWLGLLESRRLQAAANQLQADMRLAHTSAINQLTDWRVVLVPNNAEEDEGPDYYLVKLSEPYEDKKPKPTFGAAPTPRTLPANVRVMTETKFIKKTGSEVPIEDDEAAKYYLSPTGAPLSKPTRTLEFNSNGAMTGYGGSPSGTVRVTIDDDPWRSVRYLAATSRIKVLS